MEISEHQYKYGKEKINKFAKKHSLSYRQAIYIIADIETIRGLFEWVNIHEFIEEEMYKLQEKPDCFGEPTQESEKCNNCKMLNECVDNLLEEVTKENEEKNT
jgi:hypothetical protein